MKPRAELAQSAPMASTLAMSKALTILPLAPSLILSRRFRQFYSRMWQLARADSFEPHSEVAA